MMAETWQEMEERHAAERRAMVQRMAADLLAEKAGALDGMPLEPIDQIAATVAGRHGVSVSAMRGPRKPKEVMAARRACYFDMHRAGFVIQHIADYFNRDWSTVKHGIDFEESRRRKAECERVSRMAGAV